MHKDDFELLLTKAVEDYFNKYLKKEEDIKEKNANILFENYNENKSFKKFKKLLKKTKKIK